MSNRATRRSEVARFRHEVSGAGLITHLIPADTALDHHPLLRDAVRYWRSNIRQRRPLCCACKRSFVDEAQPGAFLLATPVNAPTSASVTAFCTTCWDDLSDDEVEAVALRTLRKVVPGARFAEPQ